MKTQLKFFLLFLFLLSGCVKTDKILYSFFTDNKSLNLGCQNKPGRSVRLRTEGHLKILFENGFIVNHVMANQTTGVLIYNIKRAHTHTPVNTRAVNTRGNNTIYNHNNDYIRNNINNRDNSHNIDSIRRNINNNITFYKKNIRNNINNRDNNHNKKKNINNRDKNKDKKKKRNNSDNKDNINLYKKKSLIKRKKKKLKENQKIKTKEIKRKENQKILTVDHNRLILRLKMKKTISRFNQSKGFKIKSFKFKIKVFAFINGKKYGLVLVKTNRKKDLSLYELRDKSLNKKRQELCLTEIASDNIMTKLRLNHKKKVYAIGRPGRMRRVRLLTSGYYLGHNIVHLGEQKHYDLSVFSFPVYAGMSGGGIFFEGKLIGIIMSRSTYYHQLSFGIKLKDINQLLSSINNQKQ